VLFFLLQGNCLRKAYCLLLHKHPKTNSHPYNLDLDNHTPLRPPSTTPLHLRKHTPLWTRTRRLLVLGDSITVWQEYVCGLHPFLHQVAKSPSKYFITEHGQPTQRTNGNDEMMYEDSCKSYLHTRLVYLLLRSAAL
jgi:hypothetical protein